MNFKNQIKKIVCYALIMLISFILTMNHEVYSSLESPVILEPTDDQYIELRAIRINEIEGQDYQVLMQLWAHGLETKGFTFRIKFDSSILKPSSLVDNSYTEESTEYFEFQNELENNMDYTGISEDESTLLFMTSLLTDEEMTKENPYIIDKEVIGKVLDSTGENGTLIGNISFRSKSKTLAEDAITLKASTTDLPKTGIKVMANEYDYYENQKLFKFTQKLVSTNAKLSNLTTDLAEITNFNREKYEYTIEVPADKQEINILPTPEEDVSIVTINGEVVDINTGMTVPLRGMSEVSNTTTIEVVVTAEDGIATEKYKIIVNKVGGFLQGQIKTANTLGTHTATIKIYRSDQYIDWKTLNSTDLEEYEMVTQIDTNDAGIFQVILPLGKYDVLIDKPGYLDYIIKEVEILQQHTTSIGTKQIIPGDSNKDGIVNPEDKSNLLIVYGSQEGKKNSKYDIKFDYAEDGIINPEDKSIILIYYGRKKTIETMK